MQKSSKSIIKSIILSAFLVFNITICYSDDKVILSLEKKMSAIFPTLKFDKIIKTGINNIYEVHYAGAIFGDLSLIKANDVNFSKNYETSINHHSYFSSKTRP